MQISTAVCSEWSCCEVGVKGKLALISVFALPCVFPSKLSLYGRSVLCLNRKIGVVVSAHVVLLPHWHSLLQCPCVCLAGWALVNNLSCVFRNDCDALEHFRTIQTAQPIPFVSRPHIHIAFGHHRNECRMACNCIFGKFWWTVRKFWDKAACLPTPCLLVESVRHVQESLPIYPLLIHLYVHCVRVLCIGSHTHTSVPLSSRQTPKAAAATTSAAAGFSVGMTTSGKHPLGYWL